MSTRIHSSSKIPTKINPMDERHGKDLKRVYECIENEKLILTGHSRRRSDERSLSLSEIARILKTGRHETTRDQWNTLHAAFEYNFSGKTLGKRSVAVIVALNTSKTYLNVITAKYIKKKVGSSKVPPKKAPPLAASSADSSKYRDIPRHPMPHEYLRTPGSASLMDFLPSSRKV